jgi:hypothetical protein
MVVVVVVQVWSSDSSDVPRHKGNSDLRCFLEDGGSMCFLNIMIYQTTSHHIPEDTIFRFLFLSHIIILLMKKYSPVDDI